MRRLIRSISRLFFLKTAMAFCDRWFRAPAPGNSPDGPPKGGDEGLHFPQAVVEAAQVVSVFLRVVDRKLPLEVRSLLVCAWPLQLNLHRSLQPGHFAVIVWSRSA